MRVYITWDQFESAAVSTPRSFKKMLKAFIDLSITGKKLLNSMEYHNMHYAIYLSGKRTSHNGEYSPELWVVIRDGYGEVVHK